MESSRDDQCDSAGPQDDESREVALYPVVLGSPETTLVTDAESLASECEDWNGDIQRSLGFPQASSINVENSRDVVIGPLTQFHGPVTIYQNISTDTPNAVGKLGVECKSDVTVNGPAKVATPDSNSSDKQNSISKLLATTSSKRLTAYAIIIIAMLISIIVSIAVSLNVTSNNMDHVGIPEDDNSENSSIGSHKLYPRSLWGGRPPLNFTRPLQHPAEYVIISHTAGGTCTTLPGCSEIMQQIQALHVAQLNSPDIGYNFLIGGDSNIYIGRGWDTRNFHGDRNIGISFMGNYVFDELTPAMISALKELLAFGVQLKKLRPDYKLVCHNQTWATLSPGQNVYKVVMKFPNFYTGPIDI